MTNFKKAATMLALSVMLLQNTALACNCGSKHPRHATYKPYQSGKYSSYYSALSHYYLQAASRLSAEGREKESGQMFLQASRAQQGYVKIEQAPRASSEYKEISNARKLLSKSATHKNMGMYPRQLAAANFYYNQWAMMERDGHSSESSRTHFYKYINIIINANESDDNDISINQSKNIAHYFTKSNLVGTMYFPFDNYTHILNTDKSEIISDARTTAGNDYVLVVVGNADKVGTQEYNIKLSVERAETVRHKLIASGISPNDVKIVAFGKNRVSSDYGTTTYDNSANRRVEIYAIHKNAVNGCGSKN
jgi:peptidoglycan-associated lipoprotein